jgi:hypothetical protein
VRLLEALRILEAATIDCKTHNIDTPEAREALDLLEPYCRPSWRVKGFREHLIRHEEFGPGGEGQQQNLRVYFGGIYGNVRELLVGRIKRLESRYAKTKGAALKAELDRLTAELNTLPERWNFVDRK